MPSMWSNRTLGRRRRMPYMRGEKTKAASYAANDAYEEDEDEGCQASVCMDGEATEEWTEKIAQLAVIRLTPEYQTPESSKAHSPRLRTPPTTARTREGDIPSPERTVCHTIRAYETWDDESHSGDDNTNVVRMMVKMPKPTKPASTGSQASSDTSWVDLQDRKRQGEDLETSMAVEALSLIHI